MAKLQSPGGTTGKETIYVDVDDEITAIIDKVQNAKGKVVALVLPKRAPVLQSIVNMKLLKRTADTVDKNLVLVTGEAGLMPLAGAVGLHVASSPTSKPGIPAAPAGPGDEPEDADEPLDITDGTTDDGSDDFDPSGARNKTIGELAAAGAAGQTARGDVDDSIDMTSDADVTADDDTSAAPLPKPKKNSKLRVPNFDSFRKRIALGVLVVVLLAAGWMWAFVIAPRATITISTDSSTVSTNADLTLDTAVQTLDIANGVVPATAQTQSKTSTQQVAATGQQNNGDKATGTAKFSVTNCTQPILATPASLATGTTVSAGGKTYVLQGSATFTFDHAANGGSCAVFQTNSVDIAALRGGADYNTSSGTSFTVTGRAGVTGSGSADGGTDNIVKVVSQSDIDGATAKITSADGDTVKAQLVSNLQSKGLVPVATTFLAGTPDVTTSAKAGDIADNVTVTAVTSYTMLGVQKSDLQKLVVANVDTHIDKSKQVILDDGVANAQFSQNTPGSATTANVTMSAKSEAGPQLDTAKLKTQLAGKKSGQIKTLIKQTPGVTDVKVKFSPLWVSVVPKNAGKVTITIAKAGN